MMLKWTLSPLLVVLQLNAVYNSRCFAANLTAAEIDHRLDVAKMRSVENACCLDAVQFC